MVRRLHSAALRLEAMGDATESLPQRSGVTRLPAKLADTRQALRGAMVLVPAGTVIGVGNLAFGVVVGRIVGSAVYGAIGTLLVTGTIGSLAALGTLYEVARTMSGPGGGWRLSKRELYFLAQPWLILAVVFAACSLPLEQFLHLSSVVPIIVSGGLFMATVLSALPQGVLVGSQRFGSLAAIGTGIAVLRIGLGAWLPRELPQVTGALVAALTAAIAGCAVYILVARTSLRKQREYVHRSDVDSSVGSTASPRWALGGGVLATVLWSSLGIPLLFARHVFSARTAGTFVVTAALASGVIFVVGPIATAFFPAIAHRRERRTVVVGLLATAIVSVVVTVGLVVLGPSLVSLSYGPHFVAARTVFITTGVSAILAACLGYLLWASAALNSRIAVAIAIPASLVAELVLVAAWHPNSTVVGLEPGIGVVFGCLAAVLVLVSAKNRSRDSEKALM